MRLLSDLERRGLVRTLIVLRSPATCETRRALSVLKCGRVLSMIHRLEVPVLIVRVGLHLLERVHRLLLSCLPLETLAVVSVLFSGWFVLLSWSARIQRAFLRRRPGPALSIRLMSSQGLVVALWIVGTWPKATLVRVHPSLNVLIVWLLLTVWSWLSCSEDSSL